MDNIKRISRDSYKRPSTTYQDNLTKEQIEEKLENYTLVEDINKIEIGTNLRYFTKDKSGEKKFRLGGKLLNNTGLPIFIVLTNGNISWSVQVKDTIFFKEMTINEIKELYDNELKEKDKIINEQKEEIKSLTKMIKSLQKNK